MSLDVPVISDRSEFPDLPAQAKLAIVVPTARWNPMARAIIGAMTGIANEEITVLISDNSENPEKLEFLQKIRQINPHILAIAHRQNIGSAPNFFYLYDWSQHARYVAHMADDDWVSPTYHPDSYKCLEQHPEATGAEVGTTLVDIGDGKLVDVSQPSMLGPTPVRRIAQWNGIAARVTMYCASRRTSVDAAINYIRSTPLSGTTLAEDLWELGRLCSGDFIHEASHGCLVHYPARGRTDDNQQLVFESLYRGANLQYNFVYFGSLSTAIQCAMFLIGNLSPIQDHEQRALSAQIVFAHIFRSGFFPVLGSKASQDVAKTLFVNNPEALIGLDRYCNSPFSDNPVFGIDLVRWLIAVTRSLELPAKPGELLTSQRFEQFASAILGQPLHPNH